MVSTFLTVIAQQCFFSTNIGSLLSSFPLVSRQYNARIRFLDEGRRVRFVPGLVARGRDRDPPFSSLLAQHTLPVLHYVCGSLRNHVALRPPACDHFGRLHSTTTRLGGQCTYTLPVESDSAPNESHHSTSESGPVFRGRHETRDSASLRR